MAVPGPRIMLVEDEPAHAEAIARAFRAEGATATVVIVRTLREFREAAAQAAPDIALLDLNLPDGRALDVLTAPAEAGPFPVLIMTSFGDEQVAVEALKAGAIDYVVKSAESFRAMPRLVERALREWALLQERRRANERIVHLNSVLNGIRAVNRLITRERDPAALLQQACELLVESRGLEIAFIVRCTGDGFALGGAAGAGLDRGALQAMLASGEPPACVARALSSIEPVMTTELLASGRDGVAQPPDARERCNLAVRIACEVTVYGVLVVALPANIAPDEEERGLLVEIADDVSFALRTIELQADRDRASDRSRELGERLDAIVRASPAAIYSLDLEGRVVTWSDAAEQIFGWSAADAIGRRLPIVPEDKAAEHQAIVARLRAGEAWHDLDLERQRKDGSRTWVRVSAAPLRDGKDVVTGIMAVASDIQERKRLEEELAKSEARYRSLVDNLDDVVFSADAAGTVLYMSPAIERRYGHSREELVGRSFLSFVHSEDVTGLRASFGRTLAGAQEPYEFRARDARGRLHRLRALSRARLVDGKPVGVDGVLVDITALESTRAALRQSAERWAATFDAISDIMCVISRDHEIIEMNRAGCESLGLPKSAILGRRCFQLIHGCERPLGVCPCTVGGPAQGPSRGDYEQNGRVYELSAWPLLDSSGTVDAFVHIVKDVTEHRTASLALRASEQRYRSLFENTSMGIAYCRMLYDGDRPVDFVYLDVNAAFEQLTALRSVRGKRVSEVIPGIYDSDRGLIEAYGAVARGTEPKRFEIHLEALGEWFDVAVYSPERDHFVAVFDVVTKRKTVEERLRRYGERVEQLAQVVQDLSRARDVGAIVAIVRGAARSLTEADGASFVLREGELCHYVDEDAIEPLWKGKKFSLTSCISGWSMLHRQAVLIDDVYADARIPHEVYRPTFVKSLVMAPIRVDDPIGAIGVYWACARTASEEDVRILQALCDATSVALENVRILAELEQGKARVRAIYDHLPDAMFVWQRREDDFVLADYNEAARAVTQDGVVGLVGASVRAVPHEIPCFIDDIERCFVEQATIRREVDWTAAGVRRPRHLVISYGFVPADMVIMHTQDVTERHDAEEQLRVSQRLEAVGRLAGGVAHDFNNLLSVILAYAGFAQEQLKEADPIWADVAEIRAAALHASALTRQLLAFSRKQLLEPVVLNVNKVVTGIEKMLRRLLGEDIEIQLHLADDLGNVVADPGQLEQIVMNLAVNARDAMPSGGTLVLATANRDVEEIGSGRPGAPPPGRYVVVSVADFGCGMDAVTQAHLFEPFFTTKEKGKGTGLGLATVYGIVTQSGGTITVRSAPGKGATFEVHLPRVDAPEAELRGASPSMVPTGHETVLVAEDEEAVRKLAVRILRGAGYRVYSAANAGEALLYCERAGSTIDLLLADVVMPQMSGKELADRLTQIVPSLRVLYMSGYTDDAIGHHGVLDPGVQFISKPFSAAELTRKVRAVLDDAPSSTRDAPPQRER